MMRYLRYAVLAVVGLGLLIVAIANRAAVPVQLLPEDLGQLIGANLRLDLPLFLVIFAAFAIGVATGFVWEWLREHGHRRRARQGAGRVARLERELAVMADSAGLPPKDEVLALIDPPKGAAKRAS